MKKCFLLSFLLLLTSCNYNIPQEFIDFIDSCSLTEAKTYVDTVLVDYQSQIVDTNSDEIYGSLNIVFRCSINDFADYRSELEEVFTGESAIFDSESSLYVTYTLVTTKYDAEEDNYIRDIYKEGYKNSDLEGEISTFTTSYTYSIYQIQEQAESIFYSSSSLGNYSGGLYYADYFRQNLRYVDYFSLEEDKMIMQVDNYPYVSDDEEGYLSEEIIMNDKGLVDYISQSVRNMTEDRDSKLSLVASYNEEVTFEH